MLFSDLYTIMVNKAISYVLRGLIAPIFPLSLLLFLPHADAHGFDQWRTMRGAGGGCPPAWKF